MSRAAGAPLGFDEHFLAWVRAESGLTWGPGLTDAELEAAESKWGVRFPPDLRLFLRVLHCEVEGRASFFDWRTDDVGERLEWAIDGVVYDVESGAQPWLDAWGERPPTRAEMVSHLTDLSRAARLIPLRGHRYLVGEPCVSGNPVLSIHQADVIVYGDDLRGYLLHELFGDAGACAGGLPLLERWKKIPFWGDLAS